MCSDTVSDGSSAAWGGVSAGRGGWWSNLVPGGRRCQGGYSYHGGQGTESGVTFKDLHL